jgi:hypothetical protein
MMQQQVLSENVQCVKDKATLNDRTGTGFDLVSYSIIGVMGFVSASIGIGAVVCFASALVSSGPAELIKGFIAAVTAM